MRIYESFNSKFNTYKNLEEKFSNMKSNFEKKERCNDYDPQKFMKNPKIEENFENRKYAMAEYRKSVYARSKSQSKAQSNNPIKYQQEKKFHQVSNLDVTPGRTHLEPQIKNDAFFFEDDNAVEDFNRIDNNFSNFNIKGKDNNFNKNKSNLKPNIPLSSFDGNKNHVACENGFNNSLNNGNVGFRNTNNFNLGSNNYNNNANNSFTLLNGNIGSNSNFNNPVKIKDKNTFNNITGNDGLKIIDDLNEIFGNPNLNKNNNLNSFNNNNFNINENKNFGNNLQGRNNGFEFNYNNEANIVLETQNDFGNHNAYNNYGNQGNNIINVNNYNNNFDFGNNETNYIGINNNHNNNIANPGNNNIEIFGNQIGSGIHYNKDHSTYPTLDNVLNNNSNGNNFNHMNNLNLTPYNNINIVPVQNSISNPNLNNFNSGRTGNTGISTQKRSSMAYIKNQTENFEDILYNKNNNQKNNNKDSDPFEGYY